MFDQKQFADVVFAALRRMDFEACPKEDGTPRGLNWYGPYRRPELRRPQTEPCWSQRLAELLTEAGFPTRPEVPYPKAPRLRCDNVVTLPDGTLLWLEIKGAWKSWWLKKGGEGIYRSYMFHPLLPGLVAKSHTAAQDILKLKQLTPASAEYIAFLLIGFDSRTKSMDGDVSELAALASLDKRPWSVARATWGDAHRADERVSCWLWQRPV